MLNPPRSVRALIACGALALLPSLAAAQVVTAHGVVATGAGGSLSVDAAAVARALSVTRVSLQELTLPTQAGDAFSVSVRLDGAPLQLLLSPCSLRSADFQLLVQDASGAIVPQRPAPPLTYRGEVEGIAGSVVSASLIDGQLTALVRLAPGLPVFGVQPARESAPGAPAHLHAVYSSRDRLDPGVECGTDTSAPWIPAMPVVGPGDAAGDKVCEIACDADVEFYNKNSHSVPATQADIEAVLNAVQAIYQADVGIVYSITTILVRTAEPDPYTTTSPGGLLNQFSGQWNSTQALTPRDVAHLFTGKELDGSVIGIAQLNVICNKSSAYGLSQSRYTGSMLFRAGLTSHEIGHNWSAGHCDGQGDCSIMCSGIGGCAGDVNNFGASEKAQILNKKNSVGCLSDPGPTPPPSVSQLSPASVPAYLPDTVTITGTNLSTTLKVTVGGIDVTSANGLLGVSSTQVSFTPPTPATLGTKAVSVTTLGGTTGAPSLTYTETSPPELAAEFLGFAGEPYAWSWGASAGKPFWLVVSVSPTTVVFHGYTLLTSTTLVFSGNLNGAGVGGLTVTIPPAATGLTFLTQLITFSPVAASNIVTTWIPF